VGAEAEAAGAGAAERVARAAAARAAAAQVAEATTPAEAWCSPGEYRGAPVINNS
jgi:hypothetical protein